MCCLPSISIIIYFIIGSYNFKGTTSSVIGIHCWLQCNRPPRKGEDLWHMTTSTQSWPHVSMWPTFQEKNCKANPTRGTLVLSLCIPIWVEVLVGTYVTYLAPVNMSIQPTSNKSQLSNKSNNHACMWVNHQSFDTSYLEHAFFGI